MPDKKVIIKTKGKKEISVKGKKLNKKYVGKTKSDESSKEHCANCGQKLESISRYCPGCGSNT